MSNDLKVMGDMTLPGGKYDNIRVSGELELNGDTVVANEVKVSGNCQVNGNLKTEGMKVSGRCVVEGSLDCGETNLSGHLKAKTDLSGKSLSVSGRAIVGGKANVDNLNVNGELSIAGDCNSEEIKARGVVKIGGMLNAGKIELKLYYTSVIKEIGGGSVIIKRGGESSIGRMFKSLFVGSDYFSGKVECEVIEGDNVYLEYVKAPVVRGTNVKIGPGCEIGTVEYKQTYFADEDSRVENEVKI